MSLFVRSPIIAYPRKLHISQYIVGSHFFIPTPSPIHPSLIAVSGSGNFVPSTVSRVEIVACLGLCTLDSCQLNSSIYATGIQPNASATSVSLVTSGAIIIIILLIIRSRASIGQNRIHRCTKQNMHMHTQ